VNSYRYYDIFDEAYVRLNSLIDTMNEHHMHFASEIRECGLFHETNPSLPFLGLEASHYDSCESFLPLKSNVVDDAPLTDLEGAFDPLLTPLPIIAPPFSSTPMDTSASECTLLASAHPLT